MIPMNNEPDHARLQQPETDTIAESPPTFAVLGFSPLRVANILCALSVCLLPIHISTPLAKSVC